MRGINQSSTPTPSKSFTSGRRIVIVATVNEGLGPARRYGETDDSQIDQANTLTSNTPPAGSVRTFRALLPERCDRSILLMMEKTKMLAMTEANTKNVVQFAPKTRTFDTKRAAVNAAVLALGPMARDGWEFGTIKCDGRWVWKPTDPETARVPTHAQLKLNGGRRGVYSGPEKPRVTIKDAIELAVKNGIGPKQFRKIAEKAAGEVIAAQKQSKADIIENMLSSKKGATQQELKAAVGYAYTNVKKAAERAGKKLKAIDGRYWLV